METVEKQSKKDHLFKKGQTGNPNGRPNGQRNYSTIRWEAMKKIAASKDMTPEELEELLLQTGIDKALKGDYPFYRDDLDRAHGKPVQPTDLTSGGEKLEGLVVKLV